MTPTLEKVVSGRETVEAGDAARLVPGVATSWRWGLAGGPAHRAAGPHVGVGTRIDDRAVRRHDGGVLGRVDRAQVDAAIDGATGLASGAGRRRPGGRGTSRSGRRRPRGPRVYGALNSSPE